MKVNALIDLRLFQGTGHYRPVELKIIAEGGYQLMKNVGHCGCLRRKSGQLKLFTMARTTFNILRVDDVSFQNKMFSL